MLHSSLECQRPFLHESLPTQIGNLQLGQMSSLQYTRTISGRPISILFCYLIFQLSYSTIRLFHLIFVLIFLYLISSSTLLLISIVWPQSSSPSNLHLKIVFSTFSASFSSIPSSPQMQYLLMLYKNSI